MKDSKAAKVRIEESLLPELEAEEARLAGELERARSEALERLKLAEQEAAGRAAAGKAALAKALAAERETRLKEIEARAAAGLAAEREKLAGFEKRSRLAEDRAVDFILARVFGESEEA